MLLVKGRYEENKRNKNWLEKCGPIGNYTCGNCSCCRYLCKGQELRMGRQYHVVKDFITCRSNFVVYVMFCECGFYYVGKTIRPLYKRIREHIYSLKSGKGAPRFIAHMREAHAGSVSGLKFTSVQRILSSSSGNDRHVKLLRCEARWIVRTDALGPMGLNDRNDLS